MRKKRLRNVITKAVAMALSAMLLLQPAVPVRADVQKTGAARTGSQQTYDSIDGLSGEMLYDTEGNPVYAFGGEVHQVEQNGETMYYWFGVDDLNEGSGWQNNEPGIHLYSSRDLYNWHYEGVMYKEENDIYAHPKMLFNGSEYVIWVSVCKRDDFELGASTVKVLSSESITGPFQCVEEKQIDGFINLYEEEQGTAYLIGYGLDASRSGLAITKLSSDYKTTEGEGQSIEFSGSSLVNAEGGIFKQNGTYYYVNAGMSEYATARSLQGPWTRQELKMWDGKETKPIASKNQTSGVFRVKTGNTDLWVCVGDSVNGGDAHRYIWLPFNFFGDGTLALWELSNWKLGDVEGVQPEKPGEPGNYSDIPGLSGRVLYDTSGNKIYACGGEVQEVLENGQKKWYWFGVDDLNPDKMNEHPGIHLYSSSDLYNWDYEGVMLKEDGITYAHPKMLYNGKEYVMWVYYMSSSSMQGGVKVATSESIKEPFTVQPDSGDGNEYGFFNLYEESKGNAWLIYSGSNGLSRVKLTQDYTGITGDPQPFQFSSGGFSNAEGGIFERNGKYYMVNSGMRQYAVADSFEGTWQTGTLSLYDGTELGNISLPNQTSHVLHVQTQEADTYICMGDSVGGYTTSPPPPVCYIWLPIEFFEDGTIALKKERDWTIAGMETQKPEVTEKPEETKAPQETMVPVETEEPKETEAPAESGKPVQTLQPGETSKPVQTLQPGETSKPVQTLQPGATDKPSQTLQPGETSKPSQTLKPGETNKPVQTLQPGETSKPSQTLKPGETNKPAQTLKPEATNKPVETGKPSETEKPAETGKPSETEKPVETGKPSETEKPAETGKPSETEKPAETGKPSETAGPAETSTPTETKKPIEVKSVLVAAKKLTLGVGEKVQLEAAVYPRNAADRKLTYKASNAKVKVTQSGKLTAKKQGISKITIAASNGKKAVVKVTIKKKPGKITLNPRNKTVKAGKKFKIKVRLPKGTASQTLTYVSNKRAIADVSPEGKVTAKKKGYAVITVKTYNGKKASLKVRVK